ncbi:hypothetical protein NON08_00465 [Cetobacterium somerae]|uniref:hypothetical protein n=1 Tax=Cetobacterium sp. NK01 TaxID=2993530 RepID=UPI0021169D59|nr:hypothetical protein [Cetobacterium sp. NK01]MCQ8211044.1 hypothetical protein [Cetobacterium sp. NK01]
MKKAFLFLLALSTLSYSAPKTSYRTGVAFALGDYFNTPAKKVLEAGQVIQLEDNIFAQRVKYQTYSDFGGQIFKEQIFILKKIDSTYKFVEKLNVGEIDI